MNITPDILFPHSPPGKTGWPWAEETPSTPNVMKEGGQWPKISIVTPSYNQGQFLEETIRSVLLQGYPNLEYIIVDGGSTDSSVDIIKTYEPWLAHWESEPDRGQSHAINKGFAKATGNIFGWINSDDYFLPGALQNIAEFAADKFEAVAWVGSSFDIDEDGNKIRLNIPKIGEKKALADWSEGAFFPQPGCFFQAQALKKTSGLNESLYYVLDVDLWMKLADIGKFSATDKVIAVNRFHEGAKTFEDLPEREVEHMRINYLHEVEDVSPKRLLRFAERYTAKNIDQITLEKIKSASAGEMLSMLATWGKNWLKRKLPL